MSDVNSFFAYARARYQLMLDKVADFERPWTTDPILQEYRFCNVFREDDTTTKWIREHITFEAYGDKLLGAMIIARWFNRIETLELLLPPKHGKPAALDDLFSCWDHKGWKSTMRMVLKNQHPLVTGAYMVVSPHGKNKLDGILDCAVNILKDAIHLQAHIEPGETTLQGVTEVIASYHYLGPFMAYEVVTDLRHTPLLDKAPDIMTWANPGPGAARGLGRVLHNDVDLYNRSSAKDAEPLQKGMQLLLKESKLQKNWPKRWPEWEMRDVEHLLCECDKYERVRLGQGRPRQKYKPAEEK